MPNSVPSADVLLQAAARYLEDELLPTLEGYHRFQTRVSINVLRMVQRELLREGPGANEALRTAQLELADAIRDGRMPIDSPGLAARLHDELAEALAVNNPRWTAAPSE